MSYVPSTNHLSFHEKLKLKLLKAKIKGLAEEVKRGRTSYKESAVPRPSSPQQERRYTTMMMTKRIGVEARIYLLAYGFLRAIPYKAMEKNPVIKPRADLILQVIHEHVPSFDKDKWTLELIETFLDVESEDPAAASET